MNSFLSSFDPTSMCGTDPLDEKTFVKKRKFIVEKKNKLSRKEFRSKDKSSDNRTTNSEGFVFLGKFQSFSSNFRKFPTKICEILRLIVLSGFVDRLERLPWIFGLVHVEDRIVSVENDLKSLRLKVKTSPLSHSNPICFHFRRLNTVKLF